MKAETVTCSAQQSPWSRGGVAPTIPRTREHTGWRRSEAGLKQNCPAVNRVQRPGAWEF